ncbi:MAG: glyoxylase-like metal-dependent hydrolase (beta-lactamase superfamily II) [Myxococcota bacterium]|jgi:glyoxylase-like metal-dependent hydrolase (beta-lactamase superfamily II)
MANLYFRQLRAGHDFGQGVPHAAQMENFVYAIGDRDTGEALLVDPAWAVRDLVDLLAEDDMRVTGALVTHYHPDHVGGHIFGIDIDGLATLMEVAPCKVHVHKAEADGVRMVTGISHSDMVGHDSGDTIKVGDIEVELLHTPGHTPGSCCFRLANNLVSGDTLFLQGCGRVDLPGADVDEMYRSLQKLHKLSSDLTLYPGHAYGGDHASMADVKVRNHALNVPDLPTWRRMQGQ